MLLLATIRYIKSRLYFLAWLISGRENFCQKYCSWFIKRENWNQKDQFFTYNLCYIIFTIEGKITKEKVCCFRKVYCKFNEVTVVLLCRVKRYQWFSLGTNFWNYVFMSNLHFQHSNALAEKVHMVTYVKEI